ncbi:DNA methyltransferase [Bacillus cereus]|uniref:DNA methyltransferase n=1 Tax=Bacillus cereus TaxID=1396 RepID=UPI003D185D52
MNTTIENRLTSLLEALPNFWEGEQLNKVKVIDAIRNYDKDLISVLLSDDLIRSTYSLDIEGKTIFKQQDLIEFFRYKDYWDSSYTRFSNEIGLTSEGKYLNYNSDVVLDFPFKDTVLEGGMNREDVRKNEVFYHNILAKEEIDIMLSPKILTSIKKYDSGGEHEVENFKDNDNLLIKGNNLIALHSLKERYLEKVKLIFIDPPYNTGGDSFKYNDRFNHSTWLTFMKNRLEIARELLTDDGSIWIAIDDDEAHYLKVLCDEIFGRNNFISNVIWEKKFSPQNDAKWLSDSHDHILVYAKNKEVWRPNLLPRSAEMDSRYKNPDNDPRGPWTSSDLTVKTYSEEYDYPITTPSGRVVMATKGRCWNTSETRMKELIDDNRIWFGEKGNNVPRLKKFLSEVKSGVTAMTIWKHMEVGNNQEAKREVNNINGMELFTTPKPERLLQRIIHLGSNEKDIVLDFFTGSATTQAVAMKMHRQFIGVEQMDYIESVSVPRLKKVIEGEQGGISENVDWKGGGSFVYVELLTSNKVYIGEILNASTHEYLCKVGFEMKNRAFFNFKVELDKLLNNVLQSEELSLEEKKQLLLESLDHNQNYVAYSEIDDAFYDVSEQNKAFNHSFYNKEGDVR